MQRAFSAQMMVPLTRYSISTGAYDANNQWVEGANVPSPIFGVWQAGNKFSQFGEGEAMHSEDGGVRFSDFRSLYIMEKYEIQNGDKISSKGVYYNVLQRSDESYFGFFSYLVEKSKGWTPS